jgi:hypothetical protein
MPTTIEQPEERPITKSPQDLSNYPSPTPHSTGTNRATQNWQSSTPFVAAEVDTSKPILVNPSPFGPATADTFPRMVAVPDPAPSRDPKTGYPKETS